MNEKDNELTPEERGFRRGYRAGFLDGRSALHTDADVLSLPLEAMEISVRAQNCLQSCQCRRIGDVAKVPIETIWRMRNLGKKSADEIARALNRNRIFGTAWDAYLLE